MTIALQFVFATACGCLAFWSAWIPNDPNPKVPLLLGLVAGHGGLWLAVKLWALATGGISACRSVRLFGND